MRLTIITPVGPSHEQVSLECDASAKCAWAHSCGPFASMSHQRIDDVRGDIGRSKARNIGVSADHDAGWCFFVDADDLCDKRSFERFGEALASDPELIAVFGAVCTDANGIIPDNKWPLDWDGLLRYGAAGTLSMGCFVRADVAREVRFNEDLDAAEDFDFYLRLLRNRRWTKIKDPLVTIRTKVPSATGPRGYTELDWRGACQTVVDQYKTDSCTEALTPR